MIGNIFSALSVVRHAVAITLVTGAAGAMVAGASDVTSHQTEQARIAPSVSTQTETNKTTSELDELVKACLASKDPQSGECAAAVEKSGLSVEEFWPKVAMSLANLSTFRTKEPQPETAKPHAEQLLQFVAACVASHERSSKYCEKAIEVSGLSAESFWAKVGPLFGKAEPKTETTKPTEQPKKPSEERYALVKDCLLKYEHAKDTTDGPSQASEACRKAIEASGLTTDEFWKRFSPKREPAPQPTKPEPTRKPETTSVTTAQLELLVKDCFAKYVAARNSGGSSEAGTAAGEACRTAIAASGLSPEAFFRKFGTPTGN